MYLVSFSSARIVEFDDPPSFHRRAGRWLAIREGETNYLMGAFATIDRHRDPHSRLFTIEEQDSLLAAGALCADGSLCLTWATPELINVLVDHALQYHWNITRTIGPAHISRELARAFAKRTGKHFHPERAERIYQLTHPALSLPPAGTPGAGHLTVAHPSDKTFLRPWFEALAHETHMDLGSATPRAAVDELVDARCLYLWKTPEPVAMASWVAPSPNGACINYVYAPPEFRGRGHGKAIVTALATQMLATGLRYCFILTDVLDPRTNALYQAVGAQTLCEILYCHILPVPSTPAPAHTRTLSIS